MPGARCSRPTAWWRHDAGAQTPGARVSLRDLIGTALTNNPEVAAAQKKYEAARQRPTQESSLPDPMISTFGLTA